MAGSEAEPKRAQASITREIRELLRARHHLLWIVTPEERRAEKALAAAAAAEGYGIVYWDCAVGARDVNGAVVQMDGPEVLPGTALSSIRKSTKREMWVLRDLNDWGDAMTLRGLKTLARDLQDEVAGDRLRVVVVLSPVGDIPLTLRGSATVVEWPLPSRADIGKILKQVLAESRGTCEHEDLVIDAAMGLTAEDVANAFALSLVRHRLSIKADEVAAEKKRIISRERVLTWHEPNPRGLAAVGGLDNLKRWLLQRKLALSPAARLYGLPMPKGVLLLGVPGCGKSLLAKAVPAAWGIPLLRLDMGALKNKFVGESEANVRRALRVAEAVAPCVLWVDEIEKAMAGGLGSNDGGVSADAIGTILSWLQERKGAVFVVATANDVQALPPELLRKGRFDDVFFVDLPSPDERQAILSTALAQFSRSGLVKWTPALAEATEGFSGAEVAELVPTAMFMAFEDEGREITHADLLVAAAKTVPLSKSMETKIGAMRSWAKNRALSASLPAEAIVAKVEDTGAVRRVVDDVAPIADDDQEEEF